MKRQLLAMVIMIAASPVFADDKGVVNSGLETMKEEVAAATQAQLVTKEQAEEMGLNRSATYEVFSSISPENLTENVIEKLKESKMPYYSVDVMDPGSQEENYRAEVTEYFGKVE
ncbi:MULTISPECIES: hypothetical protein [Photobacterium]|uniref:DUF3316 domain-containing protein n=1 Tax=Photobacterium halotolerans TaxID=265726 RepID=A0A0F5VGN8_9GAMM|nr:MULTISPECIES: hypothetical protein [Photobacterium]KKD01341.1 hypothetical protein KY46_00450 [Photobacterium halotolerans]UIP27122.1 hypothetical protein LN341_10805 [Photobacterium sp. TLY01]